MKVNKKVFFELENYDLDEAITEFLDGKDCNYLEGSPYESDVENDWTGDSLYSFVVTHKLNKPERDIIKKGIFDGLTTNIILNWMCSEGKIEPGEYLIKLR